MLALILLEALWFLFEVCITAIPEITLAQTERRSSCSTKTPSLMIPITSVAPTLAFHNSSLFVVSREQRSDLAFDLLFSIDVPNGSYGCQLELRFPYGYHDRAMSTTRVQFWTLESVINPDSSWMSAPPSRNLIGTALMQNGTTKVVINSYVCHQIESIRASIDSGSEGGIVAFDQLSSEGLILTYDC